MGKEVLIVAGEASADLHGAELVKELKTQLPGYGFFGVGGRELARQGVEITVSAEKLNVVGIADWWDKVSTVLGAYKNLKAEIDRRKPSIAVLLDLPDFNLKLAKHLKAMGIPTVYYISPQVWAWRKYRVRRIRRDISRMLVVFPFEKKFYDANGIDARFVGHPLLDQMEPRTEFRTNEQVTTSPRIAILPGSRPSELRHHAQLVREVADRLNAIYPTCEIRVPVASTLASDQLRAIFPPFVTVQEGDSREVMRWADVALVASGTATLEMAIIGTPFCLFYRMSPSTSWIVQNIIRYRRFFGMPNLLHGREVAREFIHDAASPEALVQECRRMIEDPEYRQRVALDLGQCRALLGDPGASHRAAAEVVDVLAQPIWEKTQEGRLVTVPT